MALSAFSMTDDAIAVRRVRVCALFAAMLLPGPIEGQTRIAVQ
jgi:hypothetical protein